MEKPARPIQFSYPTDICIRPMKLPNGAAFWYLSMRHEDRHIFIKANIDSFAKVIKEINDQLAKARFSDEEIYQATKEYVMPIIRNKSRYVLSVDGNTYSDKHDKHDWTHADEVRFVEWYISLEEEN